MRGTSYICFVAGRSGGHIIPGLTLAKKENKQDKQILFFTTHKELDKKTIEQEVVDIHIALWLDNIASNPIKLARFGFQFCIALIRSFFYLIKYKPQKIVSMGGYISLPVCIAGLSLRIPIELYELNAQPGKATKILAPLAQTIFVCFKEAKKFFNPKKCYLTTYPIRFTKHISKTEAYQQCNLESDKKTIFILGGSQGSIEINNNIKKLIQEKQYDPCAVQFIHQTGKQDTTNWEELYKKNNFQAFVFDYYASLEHCWTIADLVICRAGAGALFEALHFQKKCILFPLMAKTTSHQQENALAMIKEYPGLFSKTKA